MRHPALAGTGRCEPNRPAPSSGSSPASASTSATPGTRWGLALGLAVIGLLLLLVVSSGGAQAIGEQVRVLSDSEDVLEGESVAFNVSFGANDDTETVHVNCSSCTATWERSIRYNPEKSNCEATGGQRHCTLSFPEGFEAVGSGPAPSSIGEPSHAETYTVSVQGVSDASDTFDVHLSSVSTCRNGNAHRSDVVLFAVSGIPDGEEFTVRVEDNTLAQTTFERTQVSSGEHIAWHFLWRVPLDYPLGDDLQNAFSVHVDAPSKPGGGETQDFLLMPGGAYPEVIREPGQGNQGTDFDRTEQVDYWLRYRFLAAPPGCDDVNAFERVVFVHEEQLELDHLRAHVNKIESSPVEEVRSHEETVQAHWVGPLRQFWVNFTIPRDFEVTGEGSNRPLYDISIPDGPRQRLENGNFLRPINSTDFEVHPYTIVPEFVDLAREVERLETARALVNLTYADGSPFTPEDTNEDLVIHFIHEEEGSQYELTAQHREAGLWNVSVPLDFEYEPLGTYEWEVQRTEDQYSQPSNPNVVAQTPSVPFDVVGAKPVITMRNFVGDDVVNGSERTRTVHVTLNAEYKNGVPLTDENVDPGRGGVVLNVKKTNRFGRVLDIDSFTMTAANDDGDWVRSFRIGRSESAAPIGTWQFEVIAADDSDPVNVNETQFPFEVRPARIVVAPLDQPPSLVDEGNVRYAVRLSYPDGSLFTEEMADESRGGNVTIQLERVTQLGRPPVVEQTLRPRSLSGGQEWRVDLDSRKLVPGNHYFNVTGTDIHGNTIGPHISPLFTVLFNGEIRNSTTPICPRSNVTGEPCSLSRGSDVFVLFPQAEGDRGLESPEPEIRVLRKLRDDAGWVAHRQDVRISHDAFFNRTGREAGENHVGVFETDEGTPTGVYRFFIIGRAEDDTGFAGYSDRFNVTPINVDRRIVTSLPARAEKGETLTATIQRQPGDVVDQAFAQAGPVTSRAVEATPTALGTFVQWSPARTTPSGPATIHVEGRDLFGNPFEVTLGPVEVEPLDVRVQVREPPSPEVERGSLARLQADLVFPDGVSYTDRHGDPEVVVRDRAGTVVARPDATFRQARWFFDWFPAPSLPTGEYVFEVGGRDASGNVIEPFTSRSFDVIQGSVGPDQDNAPNGITRGEVARGQLVFPTQPVRLNATVTTGSTDLGSASVTVDNRTVRLAFPTDRTTELVQARFRVEGEDAFGNTLEGETDLFRINPQRMIIRFVRQPPQEVQKGEEVVVNFVVEYPDGSRLRAGQGSPIVGLFTGDDQPLGPVQSRPLSQNPTVFEVRWEPPRDIDTGPAYRFVVSALDRWQNEALPTSTRGFFVVDPLVPDYLPAPGPNPVALALVLAGAAAGVATKRASREG